MYYLPCNDELIFLDNGWVFSLWDTVSNVVYFSMGVLGMFLTHHLLLYFHKYHKEKSLSQLLFAPFQWPWHLQ